MDNMASNVSARTNKQRKENLITRKQDKSPEKIIRYVYTVIFKTLSSLAL